MLSLRSGKTTAESLSYKPLNNKAEPQHFLSAMKMKFDLA